MLEFVFSFNQILVISGFLKTKFASLGNRLSNLTYGCGAIGDGQYEITIQISNYTPLNIEKKKFDNESLDIILVLGDDNIYASDYEPLP